MQKKTEKKMLKKYIHKKNQTTSYNREKKTTVNYSFKKK